MLKYWVWLALKQAVPARIRQRALEYFGTPEMVYYARREELLQVEGMDASMAACLSEDDLQPAIQIVDACFCAGVGILTQNDVLYPDKLRNIADAPLVLYYRGSFPALDMRPSIALVGTRSATGYGLLHAKRFGYQLSRGGAVVISGCALGIDTVAMKGALTGGMPVVGVLACGVDVVYPPKNGELLQDVCRYGCLISEYPPGTPPLRGNFPRRNRIISGLSDGVVVLEAPQRSGALITADHALQQGRDVFALPGSVGMPNSAGCNALIRKGAILVEDGWQVLQEYVGRYGLHPQPDTATSLTLHPREAAPKMDQPPVQKPKNDTINVDNTQRNDYIDVQERLDGRPEPERQILLALQQGPMTVDKLTQQCPAPAAQLMAALTLLELEGCVVRQKDQRIRLADRENG